MAPSRDSKGISSGGYGERFDLSVFWVGGEFKLVRGTRQGVCDAPQACKRMHELVNVSTFLIRPSCASSKDNVSN